MPSFDIVSKIDAQNLDNAVNSARKEVRSRYDFKDSATEINLDKKNLFIHLVTEDDMRLKAVEDIIIQRMHKQGLDSRAIDWGKELYASGNMVKKDLKIKEGIEKETAKKIVKIIKDMKLKVEPSIMDDQVRVSAKKIDDLQQVMAKLKSMDLEIPIQFSNLK